MPRTPQKSLQKTPSAYKNVVPDTQTTRSLPYRAASDPSISVDVGTLIPQSLRKRYTTCLFALKNSQLPASKFKKYAPHDLSVVPSNTKSSPTKILQNPPSAHARRGPGEPTVGLKTWGFLRYKYPSHPYIGIFEIVSKEYCF